MSMSTLIKGNSKGKSKKAESGTIDSNGVYHVTYTGKVTTFYGDGSDNDGYNVPRVTNASIAKAKEKARSKRQSHKGRTRS